MLEEPLEAKSSTPLPVLCVEDGNVILRFSEIFAIHEPLKKAVKREQWFSIPKVIHFIISKNVKKSFVPKKQLCFAICC